jgi:hypothetical protein
MSGIEGRFTDDAQRYLDGAPHGVLDEAEREEADRLREAASRLAAGLPALDARLDERVMAAVRRLPAPRAVPVLPWRWLVEPRAMRPVWVPLMAAAAALLVWLGGRVSGGRAGGGAQPIPAGPVTRATDTVFVHFEIVAPDARSVAVAGSFNEWSATALPLVRGATGSWSVTVALPVGEHQYQFVVDGRLWRPDPTAHAQVDDGFGGRNSVIVVGPKGLVRT